MASAEIPKPIDRGNVRLTLGAAYYSLRRFARWYVSKTRYATSRASRFEAESSYPHVVTDHQSPLIRQLCNVDLWLQSNKVSNLKLAVNRVDGVILRPGETMSLWRLIGRPSKRKGYLPGMVLVNGTMRAGYGGGLCQLSNLIYWMTLHTELSVTERYRHQYDVFPDSNRTLPFGSGATIAYNYIDLQLKNDTTRTYCLRLSVSDADLVGAWRTNAAEPYNCEVYQKSHHITQHVSGKYIRHNQIWRKVHDKDGSMVSDELVAENHSIMMYSPLLPEAKSSYV